MLDYLKFDSVESDYPTRSLKPLQYYFLLPFENYFNGRGNISWLQRNWMYTIPIAALYIIAIYAGQYFMKYRKPFVMKKLLMVWNLLLAVMSVFIFARFSFDFVDVFFKNGLYETICIPRDIDDDIYYNWGMVFVLSKVFELADTVFLVLKKRKLIFLHWYHHVSVMIYTAYAAKCLTSFARLFVFMNSFVHTFMYSYYFLTVAKIHVPKYVSMTLTTMQISQMAVGCYVNYLAYYYKSRNLYCHVSNLNILCSSVIYGSYFLLFTKFFFDTYYHSVDKLSRDGQKRKIK